MRKSVIYPQVTANFIKLKVNIFKTILEDIMDAEVLDDKQKQLVEIINNNYNSVLELLLRVNECINRLQQHNEIVIDDFEMLGLIFSIKY